MRTGALIFCILYALLLLYVGDLVGASHPAGNIPSVRRKAHTHMDIRRLSYASAYLITLDRARPRALATASGASASCAHAIYRVTT